MTVAQTTRTIKVDDITGKEIEDGAGETIMFAVNGTDYQIDLDDKGAAKFHNALQFYIEHATRLGRARASQRPVRRTNTAVDNTAVRAWAAANGYDVSARGRIAADVVEAFKAAGN